MRKALGSKTNKMKCVITCKCGGIDDKAKAGFSMLFPNEKMPQVIRHQNIHKFLSSLPKDWTFCMYVADNLIRNQEKFAYYFEVSDNGKIERMYNLITGKKVTA